MLVRELLLIVLSFLIFNCAPLETEVQPSFQPNPDKPRTSPQKPRDIAKPISAAELSSRFHFRIPASQDKGDEMPPQPGTNVLGQVVKGSNSADTNWTAFTLVLYSVQNSDKVFKVLTQKRAINPKGVLETAGGHLLGNQTWRDGAREELVQESGIQVANADLVFLQGGVPRVNASSLFGNMNFFAVFDKEPKTSNTSAEIDPVYGHQWIDLKTLYDEMKSEQAKSPTSHGKYYRYFRGQVLHFCTAVIQCDKL